MYAFVHSEGSARQESASVVTRASPATDDDSAVELPVDGAVAELEREATRATTAMPTQMPTCMANEVEFLVPTFAVAVVEWLGFFLAIGQPSCATRLPLLVRLPKDNWFGVWAAVDVDSR